MILGKQFLFKLIVTLINRLLYDIIYANISDSNYVQKFNVPSPKFNEYSETL